MPTATVVSLRFISGRFFKMRFMYLTEAGEGNVRKALLVVQAMPKALQVEKVKHAAAAPAGSAPVPCRSSQHITPTQRLISNLQAGFLLEMQTAFSEPRTRSRPFSSAKSSKPPEPACNFPIT